jgi:hypothetical protein
MVEISEFDEGKCRGWVEEVGRWKAAYAYA